jgi:ubiquinone biosynthesis monooxygenase Coq7
MKAIDQVITSADNALRTLTGAVHAARPNPGAETPEEPMDDAERRLTGSLMRVNHVGEVCAQALYQAQSITARDPALREQMSRAAREEIDHLAWIQQRLSEVGGRTSLLNPLWYAGSFALGLIAGRLGDHVSLGFVVETERQVEQHLASHLNRLPAADMRSRAIVHQMKDDEAQHAASAERAGGVPLPLPVRWAMRGAAKLMTFTAHRL